jgi:DNA invertase Pin-like site-specific DNA recombinase
MNLTGYVRVSGVGQVDGDGPARQEAAVQAFCAHHKVRLTEIFFEAGVSGTVDGMERPKFAEMLVMIETRNEQAEKLTIAEAAAIRIDGIVVERLDRLARELMVQELMVRECRKRKIKLFVADYGGLTDMAEKSEGDETRTLLRQLMGAIAEWQKTMTVRRLHRSRLAKRKLGIRCEGAKPYGRTEDEAVVSMAVRQYIDQGKMSYRHVATMLNNQGSRQRSGRLWTKDAVRWIYKPRRELAGFQFTNRVEASVANSATA